jgi:1-deoxy-D-xylulose-5-phosphate reductoisomerase
MNRQIRVERVQNERVRRLIVLGSTGSIGTQALELVGDNPDRFEIVGLAAGGGNPDLFAQQQAAFPAATAVLGAAAATELVGSRECDVVLNAITGSIGLGPTLAALEAGVFLALANKESLVAGGALVTNAARPGQIVPVDSEHSALAQCLRSGSHEEVAKLVLTASGGPFRGRKAPELAAVSARQALAHPTWNMGPVVTINSATLANKGLELIEAHLLFAIPYSRIETVVHPQSIIHSMVTFTDGSTIAQASPPDMKLPISLALDWPVRVPHAAFACDFATAQEWTFEPVDHETFPALQLARRAGEAGGLVPAIYNAANEELVAEFLAGKLAFLDIAAQLERILDSSPEDFTADAAGIDDVLAAETWARTTVRKELASAC